MPDSQLPEISAWMALRRHADVTSPQPPRLNLEAMQLQRMDIELRQTLREISATDRHSTPRYFL